MRTTYPTDPQALRERIRQEKLALRSVPHLGCAKHIETPWRERIIRRIQNRIRALQRRLARVAGRTLVPTRPAKMWKPRPTLPCDLRIARLYDPKWTLSMWSDQ